MDRKIHALHDRWPETFAKSRSRFGIERIPVKYNRMGIDHIEMIFSF